VPELPEVETVRAGLAPVLTGRRFVAVDIRDERLTRPFAPDAVGASLVGERVEAVERRGKYLIFRFESGRVLLIHLRMTGNVLHCRAGGKNAAAIGSGRASDDDPHQRAVVSLDDGSDVVYRDVRRFGTWLVLEPGELDTYLESRLGDEPLEAGFTPRSLGRRLAGRRAPIKAALLDQRNAAGLGNIYVDEALWRARIHPLRPAGSLTEPEVRRLHRGVRDALAVGIARQGSTLRDYRLPDGSAGAMQDEFKVYGRAGEPCERCGTPIEKIRASGRGTSYCPRCQRPDGRSPA
jgi:formamidopyrimidine-DNA glycosylase